MTRAEQVENMRAMLALHRGLVAQKSRESEQPDPSDVRLAEIVAELDPYDPNTDRIRLLLEAVQLRTTQYEALDQCIDQLMDSFMVGTIALVERLRPAEVAD